MIIMILHEPPCKVGIVAALAQANISQDSHIAIRSLMSFFLLSFSSSHSPLPRLLRLTFIDMSRVLQRAFSRHDSVSWYCWSIIMSRVCVYC